MKKILIQIIFFYFLSLNCFSQNADSLSSVKLFNDLDYIIDINPRLSGEQQVRMYNKLTQIINQTGVAEIGYSTFYVAPQLDIISITLDQAGIANIYVAETELNLTINRVDISKKISATFNSMSKKIFGSGKTKEDAINNVFNQISGKDGEIISFLVKSREKIFTYFKNNCEDVMKQADRALNLKRYAEAISLYFSIPSKTPCYDMAMEKSKGVYSLYVLDDCNNRLLKLKSYVALAQTENRSKTGNNSEKNYYDSAVNIISTMSPASEKCYQEALLQIEKIESQLNEKQKKEWDYISKAASDETEIEKARYRAMANINKDYRPSEKETKIMIVH